MKKFGIFAVFLFVTCNLFLVNLNPLSGEELSGTLVALAVDGFSNGESNNKIVSCKTLYFVRTEDREIHPVSLPLIDPPKLSPGQRVTISGHYNKDSNKRIFISETVKISGNASAISINSGPIHLIKNSYIPQSDPVSGEQMTRVIKLRFPDLDIPEWEEGWLERIIFNDPLSVNAYCEEYSVGKMRLVGDVHPDWITMPNPASYYGYGTNDLLSHLNELIADAIIVSDYCTDFQKYSRLIFIMNGKKWGYAFAYLGKNKFKTYDGQAEFSVAFASENNAVMKGGLIRHELFHGFGLRHANSRTPNGQGYEYGDDYDTMGQDGHINGLSKYVLGWIKIEQVQILESSRTFWLRQRELKSNGIKLGVIPIGFDDYRKEFELLFVEYHRGLGLDSDLLSFNKNKAVNPKNLVLLRENAKDDTSDSVIYVGSDDGDDCLDLESKKFQHPSGVSLQVLQKTREKNRYAKAEVQVILNKPIPSSITVAVDITVKETSTEKIVDKIVVKAKTKDSSEHKLQVGRITCEIYDKAGILIFNRTKYDRYSATFIFHIKNKKIPAEIYRLVVRASKNDYADVIAETSFETK